MPVIPPPPRIGTVGSLRAVSGSWRLLSVTLLSFASGLPLGLVWFAIPTWLSRSGVSNTVVGLLTLAHAPWTFKLLWSPLMDRYAPPLLGRKRGWILLSQVVLLALGLAVASVAAHPEAFWVIFSLALAIAIASATQDIAYDGYAVEVLQPEEHGLAVGARLAFYRAAMLLGGSAVTLAGATSWRLTFICLALCYLPLLAVSWFAPEPEFVADAPKTLKEAVWGPFVGFLAQHRALEILAFVILYKLSDNLTQALTRPFLVQVGFGDFDVGVATATIGQVAAIGGAFLGGVLTRRLGLGRALWLFGFLQIFSNLGYAAVAQVGVNRPLMYAAQAFELGSTGLGSGAFGVLLLRLTQKRFSATQYALLSSLFTIPRVLAGPPAGLLADTIGWRDFFILTVFTGIPGLMFLHRFVPWGVREPEFQVAAVERRAPLRRSALLWRAFLGAGGVGAASVFALAGLEAIQDIRAGRPWHFAAHIQAVLLPRTLEEGFASLGVLIVGLGAGLATAATLAARGSAPDPGMNVAHGE